MHISEVFSKPNEIKDIYDSMTRFIFFTNKGAWEEDTTISEVCKTIKFRLNSIFCEDNALTSLKLKHIVHIYEHMK